jgi:hypothetical protein
MRLSKSNMNWGSIQKKLKTGIALSDRKNKVSARKFNSNIEKTAYSSARSSGQLGDFSGGGPLEKLQSGELLPDQIFGWSTKTVLAILLGLLLFKVKKLQKGA